MQVAGRESDFPLEKADYDNDVKSCLTPLFGKFTPNMVLSPPRESRRNNNRSSEISLLASL